VERLVVLAARSAGAVKLLALEALTLVALAGAPAADSAAAATAAAAAATAQAAAVAAAAAAAATPTPAEATAAATAVALVSTLQNTAAPGSSFLLREAALTCLASLLDAPAPAPARAACLAAAAAHQLLTSPWTPALTQQCIIRIAASGQAATQQPADGWQSGDVAAGEPAGGGGGGWLGDALLLQALLQAQHRPAWLLHQLASAACEQQLLHVLCEAATSARPPARAAAPVAAALLAAMHAAGLLTQHRARLLDCLPRQQAQQAVGHSYAAHSNSQQALQCSPGEGEAEAEGEEGGLCLPAAGCEEVEGVVLSVLRPHTLLQLAASRWGELLACPAGLDALPACPAGLDALPACPAGQDALPAAGRWRQRRHVRPVSVCRAEGDPPVAAVCECRRPQGLTGCLHPQQHNLGWLAGGSWLERLAALPAGPAPLLTRLLQGP
jgi:hypothetical protein